MKEEYICPNKYAWRKLEGKVVILDTSSGEYYVLNETASLIWERLLSHQEPQEICQRLIQEYETSEERALQDMKELIQRLRADGLLVRNRAEK